MLAALQIVQSPEKAGVLLQPGRLRLLKQLTEPDSAAGEERRKGNCVERLVRAVAREFLIAPQAGDLASTAARMIRELASLCIRARRAGKRVATLTLVTGIRFASVVSRVIIDNRSVTEPRAPASGLRTPSETLDQVEETSRDTTLALNPAPPSPKR